MNKTQLKAIMFSALLCAFVGACSSDDPITDNTENTTDDSSDDGTNDDGGTTLSGSAIGFATVGTTPTGGQNGSSRIVTTSSELSSALSSSSNLIIYIKDTITVSSMIKVKATNKTLLGLPGSALVNPNRTQSGSGILYFQSGSNNLILRNITFMSAGAYDVDGNDNLCIDGTTNIWVDHCDFQDGVDGNFDCKNASDNIAVTWCRFRYLIDPLAGGSGGSDDHRFSDLWGASDSATGDSGHLNTTFQYCWWDEGCRERMPRVRYGKVHIANCLYKSSVTNYCIGVGVSASIYVENSVFSGIRKVYDDKSNSTGAINLTGCSFQNVNTNYSYDNFGSAFNPYEYYSLDVVSASEVEALVTASTGAGATLEISEP